MAKPRRFPFVLLLLLVVPLALGLWWFVFRTDDDGTLEAVPLATAERGRLRVTVLEGGSLEALKSHTVTSGVEGQAAILYIVEEGVVLTQEDIDGGKVIVQLDSAGIEEKLERQKIDLASARASYENAVASLEIQRQQNASDIRKAELDVRFALLDLARYVGSDLVDPLVAAHRREALPVAETTLVGGAETTGSGSLVEEGGAPDSGSPSSGLRRVILTLLESSDLEGEALQRIRELGSNISLADEEFTRAKGELDWSLKLEEKGYVSREEKEADRIALERRKIELERARTAQKQFAIYDFPKEVESLLSDLVEAEDQLSRTRKRAQSAEAKTLADVESRREQHTLQQARNAKLTAQLAACVIKAEKPGLVVYASSGRRRRWDRGERIQEGATVRERQPIIKIPDLTQLGVNADVHESLVEQVKAGQQVSVVVDALPDQPLTGLVESVAPLPNPSESWLNPDRKVYATTIRLNEVPPTVRPGMSSQVEILIADIPDALRVPVQAVTGTAEEPKVWVQTPEGRAERRVKLGLSNDRYVQILEGLSEGERVYLAPERPRHLSGREEKRAEKKAEKGGKRPAGGRSGGDRRTKSQ
jgi:multidrug resistance efflux pump